MMLMCCLGRHVCAKAHIHLPLTHNLKVIKIKLKGDVFRGQVDNKWTSGHAS